MVPVEVFTLHYAEDVSLDTMPKWGNDLKILSINTCDNLENHYQHLIRSASFCRTSNFYTRFVDLNIHGKL